MGAICNLADAVAGVLAESPDRARPCRVGDAAGASLAFSALAVSGSNMTLQAKGSGTPTYTHTATIYAPDASGIYQAFGADEVVEYWHGGELFAAVQPAYTNSQIRSNDLADAEWTASNMTVGDQDSVGLTGAANTACSLTATANNATLIANAVTDAADNQACKWWIKRTTGTGAVELTLDGGSTWQAVTSQVDTTFGAGIVIDQAALANPQIGIRLGTSGDAVIVGNAQLHLGLTKARALYAGPIFTAGVADSTDATVVQFDSANAGDGTQALWYMEMVLPFAGAHNNPSSVFPRHLYTGGGIYGYRASNGKLRSFDGSAGREGAVPSGIGNTEKNAWLYDADTLTQAIWQNGAQTIEAAFDGEATVTTLEIGSVCDHTFLIRNLQRWVIDDYAAGEAKIAELAIADGMVLDANGANVVTSSGQYVSNW